MASKENKCKYDDEEDRVSTATSKRQRPFSDYNDDDDSDNNDDDSSSEEVSSEEEYVRPPRFDDGDTTDLENDDNDSDGRDGDDSDDQCSDDAFD
jgi:hypothetical protein